MKILMYAHHFGPSLSGMPLSNLEIARGLWDAGNDLEVIACRVPNSRRYMSQIDFAVYLLPKWPFATASSLYGSGLFNWIFLPVYYAVIRSRIRTFKPEAILVSDETSNYFWGFWAKQMKIPYVSYCSVPYLSRWKNQLANNHVGKLNKVVTKQLLNRITDSYMSAKYLIAVSNSTKNELIKGESDLAKKIHILPRAVDDIFFRSTVGPTKIDPLKSQFGITPKSFVLLSVSRLVIEKGIDDVLHALARQNSSLLQRIKYLIIGQGPDKRKLENLSQELGLTKIVHFLGSVPHTNLIPYYDICDLFILPSRRGSSESFGRVFVEAAARSKPSIGVRKGGMQDIIQDGVTGFLVEPGDIEAIKDRIKTLASSPETLKHMGFNSQSHTKKNYTRREIAIRLQTHLEKAACVQ